MKQKSKKDKNQCLELANFTVRHAEAIALVQFPATWITFFFQFFF